MPEIKSALISGILLLIPVAFTYAVVFLKKKIEENTRITKKVETLVDGRYGAILNRQADTLEILAKLTGDEGDLVRAASAREESYHHNSLMADLDTQEGLVKGKEVVKQVIKQVVKDDAIKEEIKGDKGEKGDKGDKGDHGGIDA